MDKFPVLTFGSTPKVDIATWQFKVFRLVEAELALSPFIDTRLPRSTMTLRFTSGESPGGGRLSQK
jgi:hypothetical protein